MSAGITGPAKEPPAVRVARVLGRIQCSQVFVAKRLGITAPYLCSVKRGKRPLSPRLASRFEEVFGIGADWLLTAEGDMIVDVAKACRHMDLGPPDIAFSGSYGRPGAFEVVRNMLLWPGRTSRRASSTAVPVLEAPPDGRPEASKHFRGAYARLPDPYVGELYCLPADGGYEPVFRSGEFVLVQNIGDPQLEPEDVDGRVCVARTNEDGPWELLGLRVVGQRGDVQVEGTPVTRRGAERTTVRWEQLRIAGVVVMAFRTVFEMP